MLVQGNSAGNNRADKGIQGDGKGWISMGHFGQGMVYGDLYGQFFGNFPAQEVFRGFSGLDQAFTFCCALISPTISLTDIPLNS